MILRIKNFYSGTKHYTKAITLMLLYSEGGSQILYMHFEFVKPKAEYILQWSMDNRKISITQPMYEHQDKFKAQRT